MFFHDQLEERIKKNHKKIADADVQIENLDQNVTRFLNELPLTIEQLNTFLANQENFTAEEWQSLQNMQKQLDQKLQLELENIRNPIKAKKNYSDRNVQRHWLYVR